MSSFQVDILIAGGGMVGLTTALALAQRRDLQICVLEKQPLDPETCVASVQATQSEGFDPRISALTRASEQLLRALGVWSDMERLRVAPYTDMSVWDGETLGEISFSSADLHESCLGYMVENRVTVAALYEQARQLPNLHLVTGVEVVQLSGVQFEQGVARRELVANTGTVYQAQLVVAADGANSKVRQMAGLPMLEWDYGHHAITTSVQTREPHQQTARQCFTPDGPLAFLPLPDSHYSSIVWSTSPDHARELMALPSAEFCRALTQAFSGRMEAIWADERHLFPLRQRHAQTYVCEGFAVVGDAAHTIHPLAGQGMNLGLMDGATLADVILQAADRGEPLGSEVVLKRYQRLRQGENLQMAAAMQAFRQLFDTAHPMVCLARSWGMRRLNRAGPLKQHLMQQAMGLRHSYQPQWLQS